MTGALAAGAAVLAALLAGAARVRWRRYRWALRASPRHDDRIVCDGDSRRLPVTVERGRLELPADEAGCGRTAFLPVTVASGLLGRFVDPFIEARCGRQRWRQYFERGAAGLRQLNLTPALAGGPSEDAGARGPLRVELRARALRWEAHGELTTFAPVTFAPAAPDSGDGELLVLAPHPDDAEIGAYGLYAVRPAWVVTITAGDRGTADASTRVWDSLLIPQAAGVAAERCLNLAYPDGALREMHASPERAFRLVCEAAVPRADLRARNRGPMARAAGPDCRWSDLVAELAEMVRRIRPRAILAPHPLLDTHPDHVFTTVALAEALGQVGARAEGARPCLLYVVHARAASPLHPFGPASGMIAPTPWAGPEPVADTIYSHVLAPAIQRAKLAAVDAGHDLGSRAPRPPWTWRRQYHDVRTMLGAAIAGMEREPWTFNRRAPRPNEIYYVVAPPSLTALVELALTKP